MQILATVLSDKLFFLPFSISDNVFSDIPVMLFSFTEVNCRFSLNVSKEKMSMQKLCPSHIATATWARECAK